uniref:NADH-ubiquinone oxidoreductase chain 5 n=1 Tax=Planorbella pilsbryi TaxID=2823525 RepID=A0A8E8PDL7_9GAST|nr:NADH dehydrogenase subunit 5 [Planorbella pilsbryi]
MFKSKYQMSFLLYSFMVMFSFFMVYYIYNSNSLIIEFNLMSVNSCEFVFSLILDKVSLMFGVVVTLISGSVFLFSCNYMKEDPFYYRFTWILLSFVVSMCFLIFSGSLLFMLMGWDGLGVTSFALIIYYQSKDSLTAGFQTLLINRIGDVFIVVAFFLFVFLGEFSYMNSSFFLVVLFSLASLTKSAQYPFSSWLPAAMAAPTPVSALVHSSTLVTAGIYLIIRMSTTMPLPEEMSNLLLFTGAITCLLGGTAAIYEFDLKKIIALSTLSQLGLMVFALGMGFSNLALFHLFMHALFKALLFLAAGAILLMSFGIQDLRLLGSITISLPFCVTIFNISGFCLVGGPFLSAFYSKHMILEKMMFNNMNIFSFIFISVATITTAMYTTRMLKSLVWSKPISLLTMKNNSLEVFIPMIILSLFAIISGKIMFNFENWFLEYVFIPFNMSMFINLMTLAGIILGGIFMTKNSYLWSTMFFMTPFYNNSGMFINFFLKKLKFLDYGWLEMMSKIDTGTKFLAYYNDMLFLWPKITSGFFRLFIMMMLISF